LDEILFQADLRFREYVQFQETLGEFPVRLAEWLENAKPAIQKKALLKLANSLLFVDRSQSLSLCRDAYRRIIIRWVSRKLTANDLLAPDYDSRVISALRRYSLLSITESFYFSDFRSVNNLIGLPKPIILGEKKKNIAPLLPIDADIDGLIILEDVVGTGDQARRVLTEVRRHARPDWTVLFVPLVMLEEASSKVYFPDWAKFDVVPVFLIPADDCLKQKPSTTEHGDFKHIRTLVSQTAKRVLEPFDEHDDPPDDPFGYKGCGALVVAHRNTPNNTLPLIHHLAPEWKPLFRRIHHARS